MINRTPIKVERVTLETNNLLLSFLRKQYDKIKDVEVGDISSVRNFITQLTIDCSAELFYLNCVSLSDAINKDGTVNCGNQEYEVLGELLAENIKDWRQFDILVIVSPVGEELEFR